MHITSPLPLWHAPDTLIPKPAFARPAGGFFTLMPDAQIFVETGALEVRAVAYLLAEALCPATGFALPVCSATGSPPPGSLFLSTCGDESLGDEGYELIIAPEMVTLTAYRPAGVFRGVQTIRQLFPAEIEQRTLQPGPWRMPTGLIRDLPRFAWRGAMLDVARHFFPVEVVKQYIDRLAYYKINRFHLHLSDDQGWRIQIRSWPKLAEIGGPMTMEGAPGGYYTQEDYCEIVAYAARRYIMVIPEIDMPGHTNASLVAYPELAKKGVTPSIYTGHEVGFSTLDVYNEMTYRFVNDVIGEIATITPGPYIHIGGDEAFSTPEAEYIRFVQRAQEIVTAHGKRMIGWEEIGKIDLRPDAIAQHWNSKLAVQAADQGAKVIMSPARHTYLDMKYYPEFDLGHNWAGTTEVKASYEWDPATHINLLSENDILGVEAPLWSECLHNLAEIDHMAFPRLPGVAEVGWSRPDNRHWGEYRLRLASHGPRFSGMGVNYYRSTQVPWEDESVPVEETQKTYPASR